MNFGIVNFCKRLLKKTSQSLGFDVVRYDIYHSDDVLLQKILKVYAIDHVIDAGANEGQYALKIIEDGYRGKVYSFEPIPSVFGVLQKRASKYAQWVAFNEGVGDKEDELLINVSENLVSSSLFKVNSVSLEAQPKTRIVRQERIRITTIDSFSRSIEILKAIRC